MTEWFTAPELEGLALPAIAGTERNVRRQAEREGWKSRPAGGKGGGREYHISSLPERARIELALRSLNSGEAGMSRTGSSSIRATACPATVSIPQAVDPVAGHAPHSETAPSPRAPSAALPAGAVSRPRTRATGRAATRSAARLVVINMLQTFREEGGLSMVAARSAFSSLFNAGAIPVEGWVKDEVGTLSMTSLQRWHSQFTREGAQRLGGKYGNRKGQGTIEGDIELRDFCIAMMASLTHLTAAGMVKGIGARFGRKIPIRTVQRFMATARVKYEAAFLAVNNPDAWKNKHLVAFGSRSEGLSAPNELWEIDATPGDIMLLDPDAETGQRRYHLIGLIDVWTRRAKVLVSEVPKSTATLALLRRAIMDWGVPKLLKTDNGKDFVSAHVSHALGALLIGHRPCAPFTPEGKPHIERFFHTLQHALTTLLPGFVGHNVQDRKAIEASRSFSQRLGEADSVIEVELTAAELQAKIDDWINLIYHREQHSALKTTPMLKAASWNGVFSMIEDERALDVLLAEAPDAEGLRVVGKKGIRVENAFFIAAELGAHIGDQVRVRLDPTDMGRIIVYSVDHEFICVAEAPERTGVSRAEVARAAKIVNNEDRTAARKFLKDLEREHKPHRIIDEVIERARQEQAAETVIAFPRKETPYTTPQLEAAAEAARALNDPMPAMPERAGDAELAAEAREAIVLQMPARDEASERMADDWSWFRWARDHQDELNDMQRELFDELRNDPVIRIRLDAERGQTTSA